MKKTFYINENYRLLNESSSITEGGLSRNLALMNWLLSNSKNLNDIKLSNNRILNIFIVLRILLFEHNSTIFFQYTSVGVPLFNSTLLGRILGSVFLRSTKYSLKNNEIIFDISDLKYEQAIDLELDNVDVSRIEYIESKLFRLGAKYIFASKSMKDFACRKYGIPIERTEYVINGGRMVDRSLASNFVVDETKLNFAYAGTLNRGRKVMEMIAAFPKGDQYHLYLLGNDGEWLSDSITDSNITYLGSLPEDEAHRVVAKCDVGLIPYDEKRTYYNIAYPTKLSFYITAGITFISTNVTEVANVVNDYKIGFIADTSSWSEVIRNLDRQSIVDQNLKVKLLIEDFTWDKVLSKSEFLSELL